MTQLNDEGLLSPSDIADLAGVSRGAVSNWRKRDDTFPKPAAGTAVKPLFSRSEVSRWLEERAQRTGNRATTKTASDSAEMHVWSALNVLRDRLSASEAVNLLLTLAVSRKGDARFDAGTIDLPTHLLQVVEQAIAGIEPSKLGPTIDASLERLARSQGKQGGQEGFIGSRTTEILARLAATRPGGIHYDPACGIGTVLIESEKRGSRPARAVGHDVSGSALKVAARRAELYDFDIDLLQTDVLSEDADPHLRADVIVLEPPFGVPLNDDGRLFDRRFQFGIPPRRSADTAWIQHAVAHLAVDGRAFVLTPPGALFRGGEEAKIRAELVKRGCVEAVVGLPGKLLPQTSIPLALWVLRRTNGDASTADILFIDASDTESPESDVARWLTDSNTRDKVPHASISVGEVLANQATLAPQRWIDRGEQVPEDISAAYHGGWKAIDAAVRDLEDLLASVDHSRRFSESRVMTVAELIDQGVLDVRAGRPGDRYADAPEQFHKRIATASDVRDGTLRETSFDENHDDYPELTRPGDVLVTTMHTVRARVDEVGGHIPSTGVFRLRVLSPEVLSPRFLAVVLCGRWNEQFQSGATMKRAPIKSLQVPLLPAHEQEGLAQAASSIREMSQSAARLADDAQTVLAALLDAVRYDIDLESSSASNVVRTVRGEPKGSK